MKQLTCEMCGSTDLMKQDGVFICQSCGTKYSVEEAKKMMVEGTVDVSGSTVKVDTSSELANLYQIARRAKDDNNSENATKYYDMILVKDPTSWEASFYVVYFKAMQCKIAQIHSAAVSVKNCEVSVLTLIRDYVPENEQVAAIKEVMLRSSLIANMLANGSKSHYNDISSDIQSNYTQEYVNNVCASRDILYTCGTQIERIFGENIEIGQLAAEAWKSGIEIHTRILPYFADTVGNKKTIISYVNKIGKYDLEYAKNYLYSEKKKTLEDEIVTLKKELRAAEYSASAHFSDGAVIGFGVFCVLIGVVSIFIGIYCEAVFLKGVGISLICGGVLYAFLPRKKEKQEIADQQKRVESLKSQIEAKQIELNELKK